jgi:TRAP-type C4-dicarboxylate transport system permease small subunit
MHRVKEFYFKFYHIYSRISEAVNKVCTIFCYGLLIFVTAEAGIAVFYRYVLNNPIMWAEEVARYTLIWLTMIAASIAIKGRSHISLTTVIRRLPKNASIVLDIVMIIIIIVIIYIITKYSLIMVVTKSVNTYSPSIAVSMVWSHTALPVGFGLTIFQSIFILFEDIKMLITEKPSEED